MNRAITYLGLLVLLGAIGLIASPEFLFGAEQIDLEVQLGIFVLPVGLSIILWGASSPDPSVTTVGGVFGNPDENLMRRREKKVAAPKERAARYQPNPREPVNCASCYTMIPADEVFCPRCGVQRACRGCGRKLFYLAGGIRCAPCIKSEVYCHCPKLRGPIPSKTGARPLGR